MEILFALIPLAVVLVAAAAVVFIRAVYGGQFEDLDAVAARMPDDEP